MKSKLETFDRLLELNIISDETAENWAKQGYEEVIDLDRINTCHVKSSYPSPEGYIFVVKYDATDAEMPNEVDDDDEEYGFPNFI